MSNQPYRIEIFLTKNGKSPFLEWLEGLDIPIQQRIEARINRIELGHFGDHKHLEGDLFEMKIHTGPGFRVYYSVRKGRVVLLLAGGAKGSQRRDIGKAKELLISYLGEN